LKTFVFRLSVGVKNSGNNSGITAAEQRDNSSNNSDIIATNSGTIGDNFITFANAFESAALARSRKCASREEIWIGRARF
jgi:hypothetical protein